jgi:hypothetical protein
MDTAGNQLRLDSHGGSHDLLREEPLGYQISAAEWAEIKRVSTPVGARASAADVNHALLLLSKAQKAKIWRSKDAICDDGASHGITGYVVSPAAVAWTKVPIQMSSCSSISAENVSPAARELAKWVHQLVGDVVPRRR